jgi:transposase-like protein
VFGGEIEVDKSYFGGIRKGKRGRGSGGKIPVFGLLGAVDMFIQRLFLILLLPL